MKRFLAGGVAVGVVFVAGGLGAGVSTADETALIVPGTGPPPEPFVQFVHDYDYVNMPIHIGENYYDSAAATRRLVSYPGSLWPLTGLDSLPVGDSIAAGANNLDTEIRRTSGPIVVPALSQGSMVVDAEKARLARDPNAPSPDSLRFIEAGNPNILAQRIFAPGTFLPVLNYTVPAPVESQYDTIAIKGEYDAWADPPDRMDNILAVANSIVGGLVSHTETGFTTPASVAPNNITATTNSRGGTTTTYFLPAEHLPLTKPLRDMGVPVDLTNQLDAALRPVIDSAYYRHNPPSAADAAPMPAFALSQADQVNVDNAVQQISNLLQQDIH